MVLKIVLFFLIIIGIILLAIGLFLLVAILGIKMKAKPDVEQIDLSPMTGVRENFFTEYNQFLTSEGFEYIGDYSVSNISGKAAETRVYRNLDEGIEAVLFQQAEENIRKITISFETMFEDGLSIVTTTNREPGVFILKNKRLHIFPYDDYKEMLKFHRQKLEDESGKREIALEKMSEPIEESIVNSSKKEMEEQLEYGILSFDAVNQIYSFTFYGAVRSIYKMITFSMSNGKDKSMFDTQHRIKNKKKEWINSFKTFGIVFMLMGLASFAKGTPNSAVKYFRIFSVLFGAIAVIVTNYFLRTKKFEDSWK